jgi:hypothetical protein
MTGRFALGALAALCFVPGFDWADSGSARLVAIVTEVEGLARSVVGGRGSSPEVADPVQNGAILVLERGARIVLTYPAAGAIYELRGPGRFAVQADAVTLRAGSGHLARRDLIPALRALRIQPDGSTLQGSAAMRGASAPDLQASGPNGTQLTRDAIRLCWKPLGPQWTYRVRLIDDDGIVLYETQTAESSFELPATVSLQANAPYVWHVQAAGPDGRSAEAAAQFRRLDPETEQALLAAEALESDLDATGRALIRIARQQQGFAPGGAAHCSGDHGLNESNSAVSE